MKIKLAADWLKTKYLKDILTIEDENQYRNALTEQEIKDKLANGGYMGRVYFNTYELGGSNFPKDILGYAIYKINKMDVTCLRVEAKNQNPDVVKYIIDELTGLLHYQKRPILRLEIDERETPTHLFLQKYGFKVPVKEKYVNGKKIKAGKVNRGDTKDYHDTYVFEFVMTKEHNMVKLFGEYQTDIKPKEYDPAEPEFKKKKKDDEDDGMSDKTADLL